MKTVLSCLNSTSDRRRNDPRSAARINSPIETGDSRDGKVSTCGDVTSVSEDNVLGTINGEVVTSGGDGAVPGEGAESAG